MDLNFLEIGSKPQKGNTQITRHAQETRDVVTGVTAVNHTHLVQYWKDFGRFKVGRNYNKVIVLFLTSNLIVLPLKVVLVDHI